VEAEFRRGLALHERGEFLQAREIYLSVLREQPHHFQAIHLLGVVACQMGNADLALQLFDQALGLNRDSAAVYGNRGLALHELKRFDSALENYDQAIKLNPNYPEAHLNRGSTLQELNRLPEALASYDSAIRARPDYAAAHCNRGVVLQKLKRLDEALESYGRAIQLKPDYAEVYNNLGLAFHELKRMDEALRSYETAIGLKSDYAQAYSNRGLALEESRRFKDAVTSYDHALKLQPKLDFLFGTRLHTRMRMCDWTNAEREIPELLEQVRLGERATTPLALLGLTSSPALQRKAAETWVDAKFPPSGTVAFTPKPRRKKVHLAYFSADFRTHAVSLLAAQLFETHDRGNFKVTAFSTTAATKDAMRERLENAFDDFIDVSQMTDDTAAELARNMGVDIAVDLGGHTQNSRIGIFAKRAAPIQVTYLGYLGTSGAPYIDYLIADRTVIPQEHRHQYSEKIIYLPSFQVNDSKRKISEHRFTRAELGLPKTGFVYCCFNNSYKLTPSTFDSWMRILRSVEGSALYLLADNDSAMTNLKEQARLRRVDPQRLIFAAPMAQPEHLARYKTADLFLDTLPCNAGATASDALWAGLPVLTRMGEAFSSRVAASLLHAIDLPELIVSTATEYEALAIKLGKHPNQLKNIKDRLRRARLRKPLFDTKRFTSHLEDAYVQMYDRHRTGLAPDDLIIGS